MSEARDEWTMRYRLNGVETLGADGGHVFDSRQDAERHITVWQKLFKTLTYTDVEYLKRTVTTGPWERSTE